MVHGGVFLLHFTSSSPTQGLPLVSDTWVPLIFDLGLPGVQQQPQGRSPRGPQELTQASSLSSPAIQRRARTASFLRQFIILQGLRMTDVVWGPLVGFGRAESKHPSGHELATVAQPSERLRALAPLKTRHFCERCVGWKIVICVHRSWRSDALGRKPASALRAALAEGEGIAKASSERIQVACSAGAAAAAGVLVAELDGAIPFPPPTAGPRATSRSPNPKCTNQPNLLQEFPSGLC